MGNTLALELNTGLSTRIRKEFGIKYLEWNSKDILLHLENVLLKNINIF